MQICFYRHSLLNRGGDKMVVDYANYLQSRGHAVAIMANQVMTLFKSQANIRKISKGRAKAHTIVHALLTKRNDDIIIADIIVMTFLLSIRNKKRVLYFAQDYDESYYKNPLMKLFVRAVYYYCLTIRKIPVIAVSEDIGKLLGRRFNASVTVVENGVDGEIYFPDPDSEFLAVKGNRKAVLVFSRRDYRKGFDIAVLVLSTFKKEIDNGSLAVWSVGEKIAVPFSMQYFGFVNPDILRKILSCSDVLLYPSRHEGLPLFVLEAMACGCPVVTTEAVRFVNNNKDALQCRTDDVDNLAKQVKLLLSSDSSRNAIRSEAFTSVKNYDIRLARRKFENALIQFHHRGQA